MKHLILTILFTLSLFAQEIGVPYVQLPKDAKELNIGLSRDGKTFYTYENNTLIHWSMNPVQIIDSVKITDPMFSPKGLGFPFNFDFTPDGKKIIFSHPKRGIGLFDLEKKELTKKRSSAFFADVLIGSNILQLDPIGLVSVIDTSNLATIKQLNITLREQSTNEEDTLDVLAGIFRNKTGDNFVVISTLKITIFDTKSLKKVREIDTNGFGLVRTSLDHQIVQSEPIIFDHSGLEPHSIIPMSVQCFDMNTLHLSLTKGKECMKLRATKQKNHKTILNSYDIKSWHNSHIDQMYDDSSRNALAWLADNKFYQLSEIDWLVITPDGHFDGSSDSRKYLYIKTPSGESVPIDDATYNKYHKQINLKD
jgi:hypothetical protein